MSVSVFSKHTQNQGVTLKSFPYYIARKISLFKGQHKKARGGECASGFFPAGVVYK